MLRKYILRRSTEHEHPDMPLQMSCYSYLQQSPVNDPGLWLGFRRVDGRLMRHNYRQDKLPGKLR